MRSAPTTPPRPRMPGWAVGGILLLILALVVVLWLPWGVLLLALGLGLAWLIYRSTS